VYTGHVNSTEFYKYHRLLVKSLAGNGGEIYINELEYYGYEEGSGSLDTTLKSVYNVPATTGTQLEVYYDAKDLADGAVTSVVDSSPNTNTGTGTDVTVSNGAFVFNGTSSRISGAITQGAGAYAHTAGLWYYTNDDPTTLGDYIYQLGSGGTNTSPSIQISSGKLYISFMSNYYEISVSSAGILSKQWVHIFYSYDGSLTTQNSVTVYINGVKMNMTGPLGSSAGSALSLGENPQLRVGCSAGNAGLVNGSIANFRLYSKVLNAGQIQELYDYQKDYFLGSKSQVTLYKGHLGVGVTEPSGQLELAGDERIQEYPPRGLVGDNLVFDPAGNAYDYNVEGHGVFKLSSTYRYHASTSDDRRIYKLFDKSDSTFTHWSSFNGSSPYEATTNAQITTLDGGGTITAHFAEIQMPYKITLKKYILTSSSQVPRALKTGMIVGSNDGNVFHVLDSVSDFGFTATTQPKEYTVDNTTTPYRIFRLLLMNTNGNATCNMNEWRLFGTPGPTTLDKGSLTLGRSLDVPRVSRYDVDTETPRPEKLVVDFDTTVNSSPTDISGRGNHGTFYNGASHSPADKAFNFDGTDDYIDIPSVSGVGTGAWVHSMSFWFKIKSNDQGVMFLLGRNGNTRQLGVQYNGPSSQFQYYIYGCNARVQVNGADWLPDLNRWYHCVTIFKNSETTAGGSIVTGREIYIDGVKQTLVATGNQIALDLDSSEVRFGNQFNNVNMDYQLSNPKIYSVALEPSEVRKLYNLGRTGRSMVISDTAVGIGKVPEAQLDVRGVLKASVGLFPDKPFFACPVANYGLKAFLNPTVVKWYSGSGVLSNYTFTTAERWLLGTTAPEDNVMYATQNVKLVSIFNDSASETSGVQVPYKGKYLLLHQNRTNNTAAGTMFLIYSQKLQEYIVASINNRIVPYGGNSGTSAQSNSVQTVVDLDEGDIVSFIFRNNPNISGAYEQFVSLVML